MQRLDDVLRDCETLHGHMCAGQLLGARMALLGCATIGLDDPKGADRKKLIVWVEIDRCMADAVSAVTGARLGKRSLKYVDYGKVAATFLNTETKQAVRIVALESSRELADERHAHLANRSDRQFRTYREAMDSELFRMEDVEVQYSEFEAPGRPRSRVMCSQCGEGINDGREIRLTDDDRVVCRPCALGGYYTLRT
ncbi:MAG: FmdE family protein [Pyrinomonadaceae bacterium]